MKSNPLSELDVAQNGDSLVWDGGNKRYLMLSNQNIPMNSNTDKKMRLEYKNQIYNVHDKSINQ